MSLPVDEREGEERSLHRKRGTRFAIMLWGTVGLLLLVLATNDVLRGAEGAGVGWLAIVSLAAGTMLIHAAVRIARSDLRR
jgi:hypothetical protein